MIELRALGPLRLRDPSKGHEITSILARTKPSALLIYLVLAEPGTAHTREDLCELLWPASSDAHARNSLNQALHVLRRGLGPGVIETNGDGGVTLRPHVLWCDVREFEKALEVGLEREALELYRGDLWDGAPLADCVGFEHWLDRQRGRLRDQAVHAATSLAARLDGEGSVVDAVHWLRQARSWAPYDEALARQLITLLTTLGETGAARREYESYRGRVASDLGAEPSVEMQELARITDIQGDKKLTPDPPTAASAGDHTRPVTEVRVAGSRGWGGRRERLIMILTTVVIVLAAVWGLWRIGVVGSRGATDAARSLIEPRVAPLASDRGFTPPPDDAPVVRAWIAFAGSRSVAVVNAGRDFMRIVWAGQLPGDVTEIAISPDGQTAYAVTSFPRPGVAVINTSSFEWSHVTTGLPWQFGAARSIVSSVAVDPNGRFVYALDKGNNAVVVIDATEHTTRLIPLPGDGPISYSSGDLEVSPDGERVYVAGHRFVTIETRGNTVEDSLDLKRPIGGIAVSRDGRRAYATHIGLISVIDLERQEVIDTITTGVREATGHIIGIAISPDGSTVYANTCCSQLLVISTETNTVVDSVRVFPGPGEVSFTPDGAYAWVVNAFERRFTVINTATLKRAYTTSIPGWWPVGITMQEASSP